MSDTHETHRVRVINSAGQIQTEADLGLPKGARNWSARGQFRPDHAILTGNFTLEMIATGARQRFFIERDDEADTYRLTALQ